MWTFFSTVMSTPGSGDYSGSETLMWNSTVFLYLVLYLLFMARNSHPWYSVPNKKVQGLDNFRIFGCNLKRKIHRSSNANANLRNCEFICVLRLMGQELLGTSFLHLPAQHYPVVPVLNSMISIYTFDLTFYRQTIGRNSSTFFSWLRDTTMFQCCGSGPVCFRASGSGFVSQRYGSGAFYIPSSKNSKKNLDSCVPFYDFFMNFYPWKMM